jgi:Family of unknown function (DUF5681)
VVRGNIAFGVGDKDKEADRGWSGCMTTENSEDDFKVGYKSPPQHSRFQPGSSGNPGGKQKAVRNLGALRARKTLIEGKPDPKHVSTSFSERSNLTLRMHMRQFTRLTNAFSKKVENHAYAVGLHMMYYNFVRINQTLKVTPAMAAGVTYRLWEMGDIVDVVEAWEASKPLT